MVIINIINFIMQSGYHINITLVSPLRKDADASIIADTLSMKDFDTH